MVSIKSLLLEVLKNSEETKEELKDMVKLSMLSDNIYISKSIILIDDLQNSICYILKTRNLKVQNIELKNYIHIIYECGSQLMEMETMITRTIDNSKYNVIMNNLKDAMKVVQELLTKIAWEVVRVYGPREAMFIVTPGYQAVSGIWREYRKTVMAMEA